MKFNAHVLIKENCAVNEYTVEVETGSIDNAISELCNSCDEDGDEVWASNTVYLDNLNIDFREHPTFLFDKIDNELAFVEKIFNIEIFNNILLYHNLL